MKIEKFRKFQEALWYKTEDEGDRKIVGAVYRAPSITFEDDDDLIGTLSQTVKVYASDGSG